MAKGCLKTKVKVCFSFFINIFYGYPTEQLLKEKKYINKITRGYLHILKVCPDCSIDLFMNSLVLKLKNYIGISSDRQEEVRNKLEKLFLDTDDTEKMLLTKLFYLTDLLNDEIVRLIIDFAMQTTNKNYRYWTAMDISKMTFLSQKGFYSEYYNDRRLLLKQIALENNLSIPSKRKKTDSKHTLFLVSYLFDASLYNSMQRVAVMVANSMAERFDEIMIVSLESFYRSKKEKREINTLFKRPSSLKQKDCIKEMFKNNIKVMYAQGKSLQERYQSVIDMLYTYNPSAIIDMSDEYSAISYFYSKDFITFYIPLRNHASSSFFTMTAGKQWQYEHVNRIFKSINVEKVVDWVFPEFVPKKEGNFNRADIQLSDQDFIIISIGNNNSLSSVFIDEVCTMLKRNKSFIWLLVGQKAPQYLHTKYENLIDEHKIIEWGFEKNLSALCSICDVILRPDVSGSSGATAIAAMQGLPIAMTNYPCDPMRWLGEDYSAIENYTELMTYIECLSKDKDLYQTAREITLKKVLEAADAEKKWDELEQILRKEIAASKEDIS